MSEEQIENIFDNNDKQWFVDNFQDYFIPYFKNNINLILTLNTLIYIILIILYLNI